MTRGIKTTNFQRLFLSKMTANKKGSSIMGIKYRVLSNTGIIRSKAGLERLLLIKIKHTLSMDKRKSSIEIAVSLES
jgi:hypothetical protein